MDEFGFIGFGGDDDEAMVDHEFDLGAAGSSVPFGPMTEAESKAADQAAKAPVMTFAPENIWLKPSTWFTQPTWSGGPPRWQIALAGSIGGIGLGTLLYAVFSGRKS